MSRSRNATQIVAVALLAALFAVPVASAMISPPEQANPAVHALLLRGQALDRIYQLKSNAGSNRQAIRALEIRGEALNRLYHLGAYATTEQASISRPNSFGTTAGGAPLAPGAQNVSGT
jgi:hypothetical protein